jgi:drug/metabolite transporter (DMT)-like permease
VGKVRKSAFLSSAPWILIGVLAAIVTAPNGVTIKIISETMEPATMIALRYGIVVLGCLPFLLRIKKDVVAKNLGNLLLGSIFLAITGVSYVASIKFGQASYSAIISLVNPVLLVVFSVFLLKEKLTRQIIGGVSLTLLGAAVVVMAPFLIGAESGINIGPESIVFGLISAATYPLMLIFMRRANTGGVPMTGVIGLTGLVTAITMSIVAVGLSGADVIDQISNTPALSWFYLISISIGIYLIGRILLIKVFEHIGSAAESGILYLEVIFSVATPMILLGENLTLEIVVGALLIFTGVIISEAAHNKIKHKLRHRHKAHLHHMGHVK